MINNPSTEKIDHSCPLRHDWQLDEVLQLLTSPLNDLIYRAQHLHRQYFDPNTIQLSTLVNIKSGGCPEDCAYCPQSAHYDTGVGSEKMMSIAELKDLVRQAKEKGASRFCMGAAWRQPRNKDIEQVVEMIKCIKSLDMESCATLGMLNEQQAKRLKQAGLDFYNHNLDSSATFYEKIISTREYQDRLNTLSNIRAAGINVCCGGIIGMGEDIKDRAELLITLASLPKHPESVPINQLVKVEGTPLAQEATNEIDPFDFVRTIAVVRIMMPASYVRLSAGRSEMNDQCQALCFLAGANSIFYGEKLLTTENPEIQRDQALIKRLGMRASQ